MPQLSQKVAQLPQGTSQSISDNNAPITAEDSNGMLIGLLYQLIAILNYHCEHYCTVTIIVTKPLSIKGSSNLCSNFLPTYCQICCTYYPDIP